MLHDLAYDDGFDALKRAAHDRKIESQRLWIQKDIQSVALCEINLQGHPVVTGNGPCIN